MGDCFPVWTIIKRVAAVWLLAATVGYAAPDAPAGRVILPQDHPYQRVLRDYLATLTEADFTHGVTERLEAGEPIGDPEARYRMHIMTLMQQPMVGFKRGIPAVNAPAWLFLLATIEGPETAPSREEAITGFEPQPGSATIRPGPIATPTGIVVPPVWPDALVAFTEWDYPGNPFHGNRALKLRAFVTAAVRMIMLDHYFDQPDVLGRSDWNAYQLLTFSRTYMGVRDLVPPDVRDAYQAGLLRFGHRVLEWGIRGEEPNLEMTAPIALWYAAHVLDDAELDRAAEERARRQMADPRSFHPAGYWIERGGGLDAGFGGMANFFAVWTALASDWPFARETVERAYRLRAYLSLPEPDGTLTGPSQFNSRIGTSANADQWHWDGARDLAALMVTDEAAHAIRRPSPEKLDDAAARRVGIVHSQIYDSLRNPYNPFRVAGQGNYGYIRDDDLRGHTWRWRLWDTFNFPATLNPGYELYRPDAYARLTRLEREKPELFKSPYARGKTFFKNFENVFFMTRKASYAAILHTGPVGRQPADDGLVNFEGPMGFGGGQLAAFWTPTSGAVLMGRRMGMNPDRNYDRIEDWRQWPVHAVSGITKDGTVFSSARILGPQVSVQSRWNRDEVTVSGVMPAVDFGQTGELAGRIDYQRTFTIRRREVRVETVLTPDGQDALAEWVETLPVFLRDTRGQPETAATRIAFQVGKTWQPADTETPARVAAIRLTRFDGAVDIVFDQPQTVRLAPVWTDAYITRGSCRNILIDVLDGQTPTGERTIGYVIREATP